MLNALRQTQLPDAEWRGQLENLTSGLDAAALNWISGYTAALAQQRARLAGGEAQSDALLHEGIESAARATVIYGSQTGHGRRLAEQLGHSIERAGLPVRVQSALDFNAGRPVRVTAGRSSRATSASRLRCLLRPSDRDDRRPAVAPR